MFLAFAIQRAVKLLACIAGSYVPVYYYRGEKPILCHMPNTGSTIT